MTFLHRSLSLAVLSLSLFAFSGVGRAELLVSTPVAFKEAQVRLLARRDAQGQLKGGLEITLAPGYKTYWKNPGDSGVPPQFDFSGSTGIRDAALRLPFPLAFDDGAGGQAFGYTHAVIFPLHGQADADGVIALKLDFAVCGKLCIPLNAALTLPLKRANKADERAGRALDAAVARLPVKRAPATPHDIRRVGENDFVLRLQDANQDGDIKAYPEAPAFFEVRKIERASAGVFDVHVSGQPQPGHKTLGPLNLTYGREAESYEQTFDVDAAK